MFLKLILPMGTVWALLQCPSVWSPSFAESELCDTWSIALYTLRMVSAAQILFFIFVT